MSAYKPRKKSVIRLLLLFLLLICLLFSHMASKQPSFFTALPYPDQFHAFSLEQKPASVFMVPPETFTVSKPSERPVIIAVIDTGIDCLHPDLEPFLWKNPGEIPGDGIDNDGNGYIDDVYGWDFYHNDNTTCHYGTDPLTNKAPSPAEEYLVPAYRIPDPTDNDNHGTHLAGIIASEIALSQKFTVLSTPSDGSGPSVQIMSLKVLGGGRSAHSFGTGSIAHTIQAIRYAEAMGADICCLSFGTSAYHSALEETIRESGMLFVAAAGNASSDNDETPVYPASFDAENLISVASINEATGMLSAFSNYGVSSVDIAAPGEHITSTVIEGYASMSGTSMSAPYVCAAAALLYASSQGLSAIQVKEALLSGGRPLPALKGYLTYPVIPDPVQALSLLSSLERDLEAPEMSWEVSYEMSGISLQILARDTGGSGLRTIRYLPGRQTPDAFSHGTQGFRGTSSFHATLGNVVSVTADSTSVDSTGIVPSCSASQAKEDSTANAGIGNDLLYTGTLTLSKPGYYTFYLCDYAGNEAILVIPVWQSPAIFMSLHSYAE